MTPVAGKIIHELLDEVYDNIQGTMDVMGDRLIQGLGLDWAAADFSIRASNANNHQITMGVLGELLMHFEPMYSKREGGTLAFDI